MAKKSRPQTISRRLKYRRVLIRASSAALARILITFAGGAPVRRPFAALQQALWGRDQPALLGLAGGLRGLVASSAGAAGVSRPARLCATGPLTGARSRLCTKLAAR